MSAQQVQAAAVKNGVNVRVINNNNIGISFGESITREDTINLLKSFNINKNIDQILLEYDNNNNNNLKSAIPSYLVRKSEFLTHPNFNTHHSETQMVIIITIITIINIITY